MFKGTLYRNLTLAGFSLKILIGAMCLFCLVANSWASCAPYSARSNNPNSLANCQAWQPYVHCSTWLTCPRTHYDGRCGFNKGNAGCGDSWSGTSWEGLNCVKCTTLPELDSVKCANSGNNWQNGTCVQPIDTTAVCASNRSACAAAGGDFRIDAINGEKCISHCDLCGAVAQKRFMNRVITACCGQGKAPPDSVRQCRNTVSSGDGMSMSTVVSKSGIFITSENPCGNTVTADGEPIQENMALYNQFCNDGQRYDEPSPGGDCDDSSPEFCGDGFPEKDTTVIDSSGMGGDFEYNYYPILDSIRDTLNKSVARPLEEIAACLTTGTCVGGGDTVIVNVPSDSAQLVEIDGSIDSVRQHIDSLAKKVGIGMDTLIDSTRKYSNRISGDIDRVGDSIGTLNDSTRKWLHRISEDIGVGTDSLIRHLDSIIKSLPDTTLDSIIKYQKYATDNFDSMLYGSGKGFALIDSLIDSTVKYLGQGFGDGLADSIHGVGEGVGAVGDSLGKIIGILNGEGDGSDIGDGLGDTVYSGFAGGYGDTLGDGYLGNLQTSVEAAEGDSMANIFPAHNTPDTGFGLPSLDSMNQVLQESVQQDYDSLEGKLQQAFDTLRHEFQLVNWDSLILDELGMKIPNTNTCPSQHFQIDLSGAGNIYSNVKGLSWPLCEPLFSIGKPSVRSAPGMSRAPSYGGSGINVLQLIRLILRIITAFSCVYIGMWFIAGRK